MFDSMERSVASMGGVLPYGVDRRTFLKVITQAAAAIGLSATAALSMAEAAAKGRRPSVIWLQMQECTGCTESLLRASHPGLAELVLDLISLDYHETLMAASGHQAEQALAAAMRQNAGKYVLVIEGAVPRKENGNYLRIANRPGLDMLREMAGSAGAIIATGSCASWGGIPSAEPNPTGATGAQSVLPGKTIVNLPGCPANPYIFLGTALQYATLGTLPALDELGRPKFAYGQTIHEHCPRRAHFDAGRFASEYGDEGHRLGYCLYKLGCKGPQTHASCSVQHFCDVVGAWPIGIGHPCFGCTEEKLAFRVPLHSTVTIDRPAPPDTYAPVAAHEGTISPLATGIAGLLGGGLLGAGWMAARKFAPPPRAPRPPSKKDAEP